MKIGIVIPVYNGKRYLANAVESVIDQSYTDWELLLVNDGSTDGSDVLAETLATRDPRIHVVHEPNGGVATARNAGLHALSDDCASVAFLDQDDIWYPESLMTMQLLLVGNPCASTAHGTYQLMDAAGRPKMQSDREILHRGRWGFEGMRLVRWPSERPTTFNVLAFMNPLITLGLVLIRRSALLGAGGFDQLIAPADDWDLWLRLGHGGHFAYTDSAVLGYRLHDANQSSRLKVMQSVRSAESMHAPLP